MTPGLYQRLLKLLPPGFREEYGDEMWRVAREHWAEVRSHAGWWGGVWFWTRQVVALSWAALRLRRSEHVRTGGMTMGGFAEDLRYAARTLFRRPGFTLVTVATLALGIGATTAIFSAVHTVLLRPLPYENAEDVVVVEQYDEVTGEPHGGVSAPNMQDLRAASGTLARVSFADPWGLDLQVEERAVSLRTWAVAKGFFETLGAQPRLGRTFVDEEYQPGNDKVVLVGHGTWVRRFGADPSLVGETLSLDGEPFVVVGVMDPSFRFPDAAEAWIPRAPKSWDAQSRAAAYMPGLARLAPGVSLERAQAEVDRIAASIQESHADTEKDTAMRLVPLREYLFGDVTTPLLVLMAAVGFVLIIACANVAGLMLARGAEREREYALRGALGAGAGRLISHVTAESVVLAGLGAALGVGLAYGGVASIEWLGPDHLPRIDEMKVDGAVLTFAVGAGLVSAVLSALAPAFRFSRPDLRSALSTGTHGSNAGDGGGTLRSRLVVVEIAAAVVLLVGAGLLVRSFTVLMDQELGFDPENRLVMQLFAYGYSSDDGGTSRSSFVNRVIENIEGLPGVTGVGLTTNLPSSNDGTIASIDIMVPFTVEGRARPPAGQEPQASFILVSPDYFDIMDQEVVAGRAFERSDNADTRPVAVVNETLARRHFGDGDPVGEEVLLQYGDNPVPREIVGVVADTRPLGHASQPRPEVFVSLNQLGSGSLTFVIESSTDAAALTAPAMAAVWDVNPGQSVYGAMTLESLLSGWLTERRFNLFLLTAFSALALVLAAVGIYGLISFSVQRRIGELGIRRALGGQATDLVAMVLKEGLRLSGLGVGIGLVAAFYLSRFIQGMLFEVEPTDPVTFGALTVLVLVTGVTATLVPALRAMRVDPVVALRSE